MMSDRYYSDSGNGYVIGYGEGYGDGEGDGEGYGYGNGYGIGYGAGSGAGYGTGSGTGSGDGECSGHIDRSTDTRPFEEIVSEYEQSAPATSIYRQPIVRGDCERI